MQKKSKLRVLTSAERAIENRKFVLPNPGDMIIMLVFGWATLCFFLVTVGERLLAKLVRIASSQVVRDALLESEQALGGVMIVGSIMIILAVIVAAKFPKIFFPAMVYALTFANAGLKPLHDINLIIKYLGVVFLGAYAAQSLYKNFWRVLAIPFPRLMLAYVVWVGVVSLFVGGRTDDNWYIGTEITFMLGFSLFWIYDFNNRFGLEEFHRLLSWGAIAVGITHLMSPLLIDTYLSNGRFQSYWIRATIFSVTFAPLVVVLFWRAMAEKNPQTAGFFSGAALIGFALILWSGSRGPSAATLIGVVILWWLFRSRLLLVMLIFAVLGVAGQLILSAGSAGGLEMLAGRLQSTESGRSLIWAEYIKVAMRSPIYGYAQSGMSYAIVSGSSGSGLSDFLSAQGIKIRTEGVHNSYLGITLRFGLVGLALFMALVISALAQARRVLFSELIPKEEKKIVILPTALIATICSMMLFEDFVPGTGKGTVLGFLLYASIFICQIYGARLINEYERVDGKRKPIPTVEGARILAQPSSSI